MRLVDQLLEQALRLGAQDIHVLSTCTQKYFSFRSQRFTLSSQTVSLVQWSELIEWLKFHSDYSAARSAHFQDCSCIVQSLSLRIAFSPYPHQYVVLRIHKTISTHECIYRSEFWTMLDSLDQKRGSICVLVGGLHSGKTTYYYDLLARYARNAKSIMSFEEPIEKPIDSIVQLKYESMKSHEYASACLRCDIDYVGLGEARNSHDWGFVSFLGLSTISVLTTAHAQNIQEFIIKARSYQTEMQHMMIDAVFIVENFSISAGYLFDDFLSLRYRTVFSY